MLPRHRRKAAAIIRACPQLLLPSSSAKAAKGKNGQLRPRSFSARSGQLRFRTENLPFDRIMTQGSGCDGAE